MPIDDRILVLNILRGLNQRFEHLGAIIRRSSPFPNFLKVRDDLLRRSTPALRLWLLSRSLPRHPDCPTTTTRTRTTTAAMVATVARTVAAVAQAASTMPAAPHVTQASPAVPRSATPTPAASTMHDRRPPTAIHVTPPVNPHWMVTQAKAGFRVLLDCLILATSMSPLTPSPIPISCCAC
jgi:hypothetical protein